MSEFSYSDFRTSELETVELFKRSSKLSKEKQLALLMKENKELNLKVSMLEQENAFLKTTRRQQPAQPSNSKLSDFVKAMEGLQEHDAELIAQLYSERIKLRHLCCEYQTVVNYQDQLISDLRNTVSRLIRYFQSKNETIESISNELKKFGIELPEDFSKSDDKAKRKSEVWERFSEFLNSKSENRLNFAKIDKWVKNKGEINLTKEFEKIYQGLLPKSRDKEIVRQLKMYQSMVMHMNEMLLDLNQRKRL